MQNPFIHLHELIDFSTQEAARLCDREIKTEHLVLGLLHESHEGILDEVFKHFCIDKDMTKTILLESRENMSTPREQKDTSAIENSQLADSIIKDALWEAKALNGEDAYVEPIHILLAILKMDDSIPTRILNQQGLTYDKLSSYLHAFQSANNDNSAKDATSAKRPQAESEQDLFDTDYTNETENNESEIPLVDEQTPTEEQPSLFDKENGTHTDITNDANGEDSDLLDPNDEPLDFSQNANNRKAIGANRGTNRGSVSKSKTPTLDHYSTDLTRAAAEDKLDPVVGRDKEIRRVIEILGRRKKNNPILIGEPGVGKSAIAEGLALLIKGDDKNPFLINKRLVNLDITSIVAGTKYRGQFEERIKAIVKELENNPDIIVFIDEIHTIIGAGSAEGTMDAANILKPALARGAIQCIGATTLDEYRKSIEKDGALERRFQKVIVEPTSKEDTLLILKNIKDKYEEHHHVIYEDDALEACVNLTDRYITDRCFPDKAIDVMDEVGSRMHIKCSSVPSNILELEKQINSIIQKKQFAVNNQNFEMAATLRDMQSAYEQKLENARNNWINQEDTDNRTHIKETDVTEVVSQMTGINVNKMTESESARIKKTREVLLNTVIGQDEAINKVVKAIQRNRMGLSDPNRPIGAFMFLGPTGVGKTYLAKQLAKELFGSNDSLIRIDMSEYAENFNTSRLVGAPPGYVGYNEGGQLTEKVRRKPYCIVLLDEIEKANDKVFNLLLQVLDEGRLTDGNGRLIDFRNTVVIMTSNAGTRQLKDFGKGIGFNEHTDKPSKEFAQSIISKSLAKQFPPEFLNRLDDVIIFDQLEMPSIKKIIDLELKNVINRMEEQGYKLQISDKAKEIVASKGYDVQYGARPLKRAIRTYIEDKVCDFLADGELSKGDTICIGKSPAKEELTFKIQSVNS